MDVLENTLPVPLDEFLSRPLFCFLGTVSAGGDPRVSPLWFRWEDGAVWNVATTEKTYPHRVERHPETALAIVDFDAATGRVQHVGMRGRTTVEPHDPDLAGRLLENYLGADRSALPEDRFGDPAEWGDEMVLLRTEPETVVARDQSYDAPPGAP